MSHLNEQITSRQGSQDSYHQPKAYGYVRVSTKHQNVNRQLDAMNAIGLNTEDIIIDRASGKDFDRPGYKKLITILKPGDTVYLHSLDRFGRDFIDMLSEWITITSKLHVNIKVMDSDLLSTTDNMTLDESFSKSLTLLIYSYNAAKERIAIHERQKQGFDSARARGIKLGRPRLPIPDNFDEIYGEYLRREIVGSEAARRLNISIARFYRIAKEKKTENQEQVIKYSK